MKKKTIGSQMSLNIQKEYAQHDSLEIDGATNCWWFFSFFKVTFNIYWNANARKNYHVMNNFPT